jgi:hypothetical protein
MRVRGVVAIVLPTTFAIWLPTLSVRSLRWAESLTHVAWSNRTEQQYRVLSIHSLANSSYDIEFGLKQFLARIGHERVVVSNHDLRTVTSHGWLLPFAILTPEMIFVS